MAGHLPGRGFESLPESLFIPHLSFGLWLRLRSDCQVWSMLISEPHVPCTSCSLHPPMDHNLALVITLSTLRKTDFALQPPETDISACNHHKADKVCQPTPWDKHFCFASTPRMDRFCLPIPWDRHFCLAIARADRFRLPTLWGRHFCLQLKLLTANVSTFMLR